MNTIELRAFSFVANGQDIAFAAKYLPGRFRRTERRKNKKKATRALRPALGKEPASQLFHAFQARGMIRREIEPGKWAIDCPFGHDHTSDSESGTVLYTENDVICCKHVHCDDIRTQDDYRATFTKAELDAAAQAALACHSALPVIELLHEEHDVTTQVIQHLPSCQDVYERGGRLVFVAQKDVRTPGGTKRVSRIIELSQAALRDRLTALVTFVELTTNGHVARRPPKWLLESILARGAWPGIRQLNGIVASPVLRPDGTVLDRAGYDEATGLLFCPSQAFWPIPEHPEPWMVRWARDELLDLTSDFPFATPAAGSGWVAIILSLLAQYAYESSTPAFVIDGTNAGTGKGLLVRVATLIGLVEEVAPTPQPTDEAEERKSITSVLMEGGRAILRDNVTGTVGSGALEALLTFSKWKDRILGSNTMVELTVNLVFLVTGNNVKFRGPDMIRRSVHIRLESLVENPEQREDFKYPNLYEHVRQHLDFYIWCALTMLRAYAAAGYPEQHLKPWGSFEGWSRVVRGCLVWCGLADPADVRDALLETADVRGAALRELLPGLEALLQGQRKSQISSAELLALLDEEKKLAFMPGRRGQFDQVVRALEVLGCTSPLNAQKLGNVLGLQVKTVAGGRRLLKRVSSGTTFWSVEHVDGSNGTSGGGPGGPSGPASNHLHTGSPPVGGNGGKP